MSENTTPPIYLALDASMHGCFTVQHSDGIVELLLQISAMQLGNLRRTSRRQGAETCLRRISAAHILSFENSQGRVWSNSSKPRKSSISATPAHISGMKATG